MMSPDGVESDFEGTVSSSNDIEEENGAALQQVHAHHPTLQTLHETELATQYIVK